MRDTKAKIHLDHLTYNLNQLSQNIGPKTKRCGVVKADGYGHGAVQVAQQLVKDGVDFLAVAIAQEAIELRDAGIDTPILVLTPVEASFMEELICKDVSMTTTEPGHARQIAETSNRLNHQAKIHLKVDSGMSRIGVQDSYEGSVVLRELEEGQVDFEGIYTHFADADNMEDSSFTHDQFNHFINVVDKLQEKGYDFKIKHACNSAATIRFPNYHLDMVRLGISLYGYQPDESMMDLIDLKPVMTVETKIAYLKTLQPQRKVGYGCTYEVSRPSQIATLILGYADGVLRTLSNTGSFIVHGQRAPIVGRVCMDQLMVDVTMTPQAEMGDRVVWFGDETKDIYSLFDICKEAGGFHYEMLTRIGQRIPRVYE